MLQQLIPPPVASKICGATSPNTVNTSKVAAVEMHQAATLFAPNHWHGAPYGEASKCRFGVVAPVVSEIHPLNNNLCYIYSGLESISENVALRWD